MSDGPKYTDLSINVRAAWNRQHVLNGGRHLKVMPAWLCRVTRNEGYDDVIDEAPMTVDQVMQVARLIDSFGLQAPKVRSVEEAVKAAHTNIAVELGRQIGAARAQIARLPELEARLDELVESERKMTSPETS